MKDNKEIVTENDKTSGYHTIIIDDVCFNALSVVSIETSLSFNSIIKRILVISTMKANELEEFLKQEENTDG